MWYKYFDKIFLINLADRFDRLYDSALLLNEYEIPFERFEAVKHNDGYFGLVLTMKKLFKECLDKDINNILVFEDDISFCECKDYMDVVMNDCVEWMMKNNWGQFYLGVQHGKAFGNLIAPHVLRVEAGYSTHAVAYSKHCMEHFMHNYVQEPIDNFFVREYQPFGKSFCSYPLLATQRTNYSNIYNEQMDWNRYIRKSYEDATRNLKENL